MTAQKALSLLQPWASLVAIGAKRIETRSWRTKFRGRIAIHASKGSPLQLRRLAIEEPFRSALAPHYGLRKGFLDLPLGAVLATATIRDCLPMGCVDWQRLEAAELAFGEFVESRFAWLLEDVERCPLPIPATGALGLWNWSMEGPSLLKSFDPGGRLCVERELCCVHREECKSAGITCPCPDCRPMPARLLL